MVPDEGSARIQSILAMLEGRRNGHALTTSEVLDFTGWLSYKTREEFAEHQANHPELEPFTPYDFDAPNQPYDRDAEEEGVCHQDNSLCMVRLRLPRQCLTQLIVLAGMEGESEKDRYKNLLDLEKAERSQRRRMKQVAHSSSRLATQPAPPQTQDQLPQ